jgi:hypothetical protein
MKTDESIIAPTVLYGRETWYLTNESSFSSVSTIACRY